MAQAIVLATKCNAGARQDLHLDSLPYRLQTPHHSGQSCVEFQLQWGFSPGGDANSPLLASSNSTT